MFTVIVSQYLPFRNIKLTSCCSGYSVSKFFMKLFKGGNFLVNIVKYRK